jgi:AraC-like DNA-binding protein
MYSYIRRVQRVTLEQFAEAPVGKYVAGPYVAHFCATPRLWGFVCWGRPAIADARALGQSLVLELAPPAEPHVSIIDARRLDFADPLVFRAGESYLHQHAAQLSKWVTKLAVVRSPGVVGAVMAGAYTVVPRPYPVEIFDAPEPAFDWLACGMSRTDGTRLLDSIYGDATGMPHDIATLRAVLEAKLDGITIARAAKKLGLSQRSLQRKLADAGTTFKHELAEARVRVAKRLLVDTDTSLTEIAFEVGCTSLQSFSALFRRYSGEPPSTFRERARVTPGSG